MLPKSILQFPVLVSVLLGAHLSAGSQVQTHSSVTRQTLYSEMCDPSAAVAVDSSHFVVADDEDNILRVYDRAHAGGTPIGQEELEKGEIDLEGSTWLNGKIYWIGSHSNNKEGKPRPQRHQLFATEVKGSAGKYSFPLVGTPYRTLIDDLVNDKNKRFDKYKFKEAKGLAPKDKGAISIEGLSATVDKKLLIGFRNPIIGDKAGLVIVLKNPEEVIKGKPAEFEDPIELVLGGSLGIRSIEYDGEKGLYWIVAGPYDSRLDFGLYSWSGKTGDNPKRIEGIDFRDLVPEALIVFPNEDSRVQILSDDGKLSNRKECKDLELKERDFRSVWINIRTH